MPTTAARPARHRDKRQLTSAVPRDALGDLRFRALLGAAGWARLPAEVRARFSRKAGPGESIVFAGQVTKARMTRAGRLLTWLCRLIGGPLPIGCEPGLASVVTVTEELCGGGQTWTRLYARRGGFPQVIHSSKRFAGPTGLEEHVGCGVGMTLRVAAEAGQLVFRSERYFAEIPGLRLYLPGWLSPGSLTVRHAPAEGGRFVFSLEIAHPRFGRILSQSAIFEEVDR